jgi:4-nitrophenyl phosphatase
VPIIPNPSDFVSQTLSASINSLPRVYVFDMDGVLFRGNEVVPEAPGALARLRARTPAPRVFFLTNNSWQPRTDYAAKLARLGMPADPDEIVTSASATAMYLRSIHANETGRTAFVVGGSGIRDELTQAGIHVVSPDPDANPDDMRADFVVCGIDRQFSYETLWRAQQAILHGALFVATNRDTTYPLEGGRVQPGGGAIVAAIVACTNTEPIVVGKPETHGLKAILRLAGAAPHEAVMIGDRLDTDVLCGNRLGVPSVLVLTGVTSEAEARKVTATSPEMRPGRVIPTLSELD